MTDLGCETSRVPHFLDNRHTDGSEVDGLRYLPPFLPSVLMGTSTIHNPMGLHGLLKE
jgi:hypothetical protein